MGTFGEVLILKLGKTFSSLTHVLPERGQIPYHFDQTLLPYMVQSLFQATDVFSGVSYQDCPVASVEGPSDAQVNDREASEGRQACRAEKGCNHGEKQVRKTFSRRGQ